MPPETAKPYHHGDLRRALLDASLAVLQEKGPAGLTLREVARRAGVSHTAPYRHFADKDELLAGVAEEGFLTLRDRMMAAAQSAKSAIDALERAGVAYVQLAIERPAHCAVMFSTTSTSLKRQQRAASSRGDADQTNPRLEASVAAGNAAYDGLLMLITAAQQEGSIPAGDPRDYAHVAWAQVHGVASLAIAGVFEDDAGEQLLPDAIVDLAKRAVQNVSGGFAAQLAARRERDA